MVISKTPFRVSFVGGGTDCREYYQHTPGAVFCTSIDKYVYVIVNGWISPDLRVSYSKGEIAHSVDEVEHDIIREALKLTGVTSGVEVAYLADIPIGTTGTGLGSSSALTVGVLHALHAYKGESVTPDRLANEAHHIERIVLKQAGGKQDQYAVAHGGMNRITFYPDERVVVERASFPAEVRAALCSKLLFFHTGLPTESSRVHVEQRENAERNRGPLDGIRALVPAVWDALHAGRLEALGAALHENWTQKKTLASKMSNGHIDTHYERARAAGASGGKILGSGGGGILLCYCDEEHHAKVRSALAGLQELTFGFDEEGSSIIFHDEKTKRSGR